MNTNRHTLKNKDKKIPRCLRLLTKMILTFVIGCICFSGCAALKEAQQRREARVKQQKNKQYLLLTVPKVEIKVGGGALTAESAHYSITFAEDLRKHDDFDEISERRTYAQSALVYMESLYNEMEAVFGFQPEHKIHVTLHQVYEGATNRATTTTQYGSKFQGNTSLRHKYIAGIKMDFPLAMYEKPTTRVHELTHAFTSIYHLPTWFDEGLAVLMETEWAKAGLHPKFDNLQTYLRRNPNGTNALEGWDSHGGNRELVRWRYRYAYTVVSELRKSYGPDFYIKVFRLMDADQLHTKLATQMSTSFLVYYFSQIAGTDLTPFFKELGFEVEKLTKVQILQNTNHIKG